MGRVTWSHVEMLKAIVNPNACSHTQSSTSNTVKGIEVTSYFEEFGNDRHTVLLVDVHIANVDSGSYLSSTLERLFITTKRRRKRKRNIFRPVVWTNEDISLRLSVGS
eukprot:scaffold115913_cov68-Attheya_sp.AAC.2